jgi:hypothetical protein
MARRHSSSARSSTSPVPNRFGLPDTEWVAARRTVAGPLKGSAAGASPARTAMRRMAACGSLMKSS